MAYIITTTTPYTPDQERGDAPAHAYEPKKSSHAVGTLEEARDYVVTAYAVHEQGAPRPGWSDPLGSCDEPRHFGPLPDGTMITVKPMVNEFGRPDVRGYLRGWHFPASMDEAEIIASFNEMWK